MNPDLIVSRAHEVVQVTGKPSRYICIACRHEGTLDDLFGSHRCNPHYVTRGSGWLEETTHEGEA